VRHFAFIYSNEDENGNVNCSTKERKDGQIARATTATRVSRNVICQTFIKRRHKKDFVLGTRLPNFD